MKRNSFFHAAAALAGAVLLCGFAAAQENRLPPGAVADKIVKTGYGLDKDQPFAGADPDGTGLPWKEPPAAAVAEAKKAPTPKMMDGHIDLTGFWGPAGWGYAVTQGKVTADGKTAFTQRQEDGPNQTPEKAAQLKRRMEGTNLPPYRPELVAKVKDLADHQSKMDPAFYCAPKGFPRVGPPTEIVATPKTIAFLYDTVNSSEQNAFRVISVDGRGHDETLNPSYYGDSVGHWEGNTLVVDVTNFVDDTWLSQNGTIHSDQMHVIEKLTREGNVITWDVSIEDPKVFTKPWVISRHLVHGIASGHALEEAPCVEHDSNHLVNTDRN